MIIPFFIPHSGCPHQCVFCDQKMITGEHAPQPPESIPEKIAEYLKTDRKKGPAQVAFYGGTFTALPTTSQRAYLQAVQPFILSGQVEGIRISTRPDCINPEVLTLLEEHHVITVELGAQSMDDRVLALSGRGHTADDTMKAIGLLKARGFLTGIQLMPGLPGDSKDIFLRTVDETVELKPDMLRIYPTIVIRGTSLEKLYKSGRYVPLALDQAVAWCRKAMLKFEQAGIKVIRVGLQRTQELEKPGTIVAGPYDPSFRQLVQSSIRCP